MTNTTLNLRSLDIPSIHRYAVGFDNIFDELLRHSTSQSSSNYPPYNIVKFTDDKFAIELAVAGFNDSEIDVTVEKNQLFVRGERAIDLDEKTEYLYRGISSRSFTRSWTLADYVEVAGAEIKDGILVIQLERRIPDEQKPRKIQITHTK